MLNSIETYQEAGRKSAIARNQHDEATANFHKNWLSRAKALERDEDKQSAQGAFDQGYKDARIVPTLDRFR